MTGKSPLGISSDESASGSSEGTIAGGGISFSLVPTHFETSATDTPCANHWLDSVVPEAVRCHLHSCILEHLVAPFTPLAVGAGNAGEPSASCCFANHWLMRTRNGSCVLVRFARMSVPSCKFAESNCCASTEPYPSRASVGIAALRVRSP